MIDGVLPSLTLKMQMSNIVNAKIILTQDKNMIETENIP